MAKDYERSICVRLTLWNNIDPAVPALCCQAIAMSCIVRRRTMVAAGDQKEAFNDGSRVSLGTSKCCAVLKEHLDMRDENASRHCRIR